MQCAGILVGLLFLAVNCNADFRKYISGEGSSEENGGQAPGARSTSCPCGWTNKARIVGGKETLRNEFPLQVAIMSNDHKIVCGGSIITPNHILTASHCTHPNKNNKLHIIAGGHNIKSGDSTAVKIDVDYSIEHEEYDPNTYEHDIALLVLSKPLAFNQFIGPACFPIERANLINQYVKVIGWGLVESDKKSTKTSEVLMKVNIRVTETANCKKSYPFQPIEDGRQICTFRRAKDSCGGDSGGPLLWLDPETNRLTQIALVSYGRVCGQRSPAVNTDVLHYLPWIQEKINNSNKNGAICHKV